MQKYPFLDPFWDPLKMVFVFLLGGQVVLEPSARPPQKKTHFWTVLSTHLGTPPLCLSGFYVHSGSLMGLLWWGCTLKGSLFARIETQAIGPQSLDGLRIANVRDPFLDTGIAIVATPFFQAKLQALPSSWLDCKTNQKENRTLRTTSANVNSCSMDLG